MFADLADVPPPGKAKSSRPWRRIPTLGRTPTNGYKRCRPSPKRLTPPALLLPPLFAGTPERVSRGSQHREARLRRAGSPQHLGESPREGRSPFHAASASERVGDPI